MLLKSFLLSSLLLLYTPLTESVSTLSTSQESLGSSEVPPPPAELLDNPVVMGGLISIVSNPDVQKAVLDVITNPEVHQHAGEALKNITDHVGTKLGHIT